MAVSGENDRAFQSTGGRQTAGGEMEVLKSSQDCGSIPGGGQGGCLSSASPLPREEEAQVAYQWPVFGVYLRYRRF